MLFNLKSLCSSPGAPSAPNSPPATPPTRRAAPPSHPPSPPSRAAATPSPRAPETPPAAPDHPTRSMPYRPRGSPRSSPATPATAAHPTPAARKRCRHMLADHQPGPIFQNLKRRPEHRCIGAQKQAPRHKCQRIRQPAEDAVLARHVMTARRQLPQRRPTQHRRRPIQHDQIIQVRQPTGELLRRRIDRQHMPLPRQMRARSRPIERHALRRGPCISLNLHRHAASTHAVRPCERRVPASRRHQHSPFRVQRDPHHRASRTRRRDIRVDDEQFPHQPVHRHQVFHVVAEICRLVDPPGQSIRLAPNRTARGRIASSAGPGGTS